MGGLQPLIHSLIAKLELSRQGERTLWFAVKRPARKDDESRRLSSSNANRAWRMLKRIKHDEVFLYAMGFEPWLRFVMGLEYEPESVQLSEVKRLSEILEKNGKTLNVLKGCAQLMI
jgi:hypothetical protein